MVGQHTPRKSISGQIFAILGVLVLVGSMAPVPWLVEEGVAQPSSPSLKVTRSDYRTEVEEIRGTGAFAYVVLEDPDRDPTYDMRGIVEMTASVEFEDENDVPVEHEVWFVLLETGIGTGRYEGGFGFREPHENHINATYDDTFKQFGVENPPEGHTGTGNAEIPVKDGVTVAVENKTTDAKTTFEWFATDNVGHIKAFFEGASDPFFTCTLNGMEDCTNDPGEPIISGYGEVDIEVQDGGLHQDNYDNLIRVFSTSNPTGVRVAIEDVGNNRYQGSLTLTDSTSTGAGELFIRDGDKIFIEYFEPHRKNGEFKLHLQPAKGIAFETAAETSIKFAPEGRKLYHGLSKSINKHGTDRAVVVLEDPDRENTKTVLEKTVEYTVSLRDNNGQWQEISTQFEAKQHRPRSNDYVGTLLFGGEDTPSAGILDVDGKSSAEFRVSHGGEHQTFVWRAMENAVFSFEDEDGESPEDLFSGEDTYRICLTDPDSVGKSGVTVRVKTSSDTTDGLAVPLSPVPGAPVNCKDAHFAGEFSFTTGSTGGGSVSVSDGDLVVFEYDDPLVKRDGSNQIVRSPIERWWQTQEPEDPEPPTGTPHAADAALDIESIEFMTDDDQGPPQEPEPTSLTPVDQVSQGTQVFVQLEFTDDDEEDPPEEGAVRVTLRTDFCEDKDREVVLFEEEDGSLIYNAPVYFVPGGDCDSESLGFNRIPVTADLGLGDGDPTDQVGLFDLIRAFETEVGNSDPVALVGWFPTDNAELSVADGFGDGAFNGNLFERDVLPHYVFAEEAPLEDSHWYNFTFVSGSERVIIDQEDTFDFEGGETSQEVTATVEHPIVGGDFRIPDCDFVSISYTISGPLGGSGSRDCSSIDGRRVTFNPALPDCPVAGATCELTIDYLYLAEVVDRDPDWETDDDKRWDCDDNQGADSYFRTSDGIVFCDEQSSDVEVDYVHGERTITGIGPEEEEDATLAFSGFDGESGVPVYTGEISVWFSTGSLPLDVSFTYEDPAQEFDGGPGSDDPDHFRSTFARSTWRPSETAEIRVMDDLFMSSVSGTVYGPGIPVEVDDFDAGLQDRRDIIEIQAATGSDADSCATGHLRETGVSTGVFQGVIDIDGGSCATADKIHLKYVDQHDADGNGKDIPKVVNLRTSENGIVTVCRESICDPDDENAPIEPGGQDGIFFGARDSFYIRVDDQDRTPSSTVTVRVASKSQPLGETLTLTRVGSGPNAYFLSGEVRFETTNNPGNGRLYVEHGTDWWVEYDDPMDELGVREPITKGDFTWEQAVDGRVSFDRGFHIGTESGTTGDSGHGLQRLARGVIHIRDADLGSSPQEIEALTVKVDGDVTNSTGDVVGKLKYDRTLSESVALVETGHNTGEFVGVFSFCDNGSSEFPCIESISDGDDLKVTYTDAQSTTEDHDDEATTKWYKEGRGVVTFDRKGYTIDAKPRVTIYDANLEAEEISAKVVSGTDSSGITLDGNNAIPARDDVEKGIYSRSINLGTSSSSGTTLRVNAESDEIEARYQDSAPPGTRKATALIGVGAEPVTSLVTSPPSPDGENGWFTSQVTVEFDTNVDVEDTLYSKDGGTVTTFSSPITLGEGIHEFEFWSVDLFEGLVEDEKTATVKVSLNDPTAEIELGEVSELPDGQIELNWEAVSGKTDPLLFGEYKVYRGDEGAAFADTELVSENVTSESFTDRPPSDNPPQSGETFTYYVRVANDAGRLGPISDAVDALSDRVAPRVSSFDVDTNELREDLGEDTVNADLTVEDDAENLADIDRVFLRVIDPFGNEEAEVNMTGSSTSFSAAYTEFDTCGVYGLFGVASDAIGNEGRLNESVRFIGTDVDAPQLSGVPTEIQQGQNLNVTVVDNCAGVASVAYSINDGDRREVNVPSRPSGDNCTPGPCEVAFQIAASRLVPGENRITFELTDANETANFATIRHTVTMIIPDDDDETLDAPSLGDAHANLVEYGGSFSFTVSGGTPTTIAFEAGDLDLDNVIGGLTRSTGRVRVDVGDLESGPHTATVTVTNAFGTDTADFSFYILEEGVPLPPVNVQVSKNDKGQPVVSWSPNPDSEVEVGGYLVHRASSPWKVIAVTGADTETYTDTKAKEGQTYQYAVTSYGANGEGRLNEGDDSEESLAWFQGVGATTFETDEIDGGIPPVVFWVILIVLAVVVVVSLLYVNRRQIFGSKAEEIYAEDYPDEAETPFGEERHMIRCPNCSEDFHVSGERPVVTDCPNCGRKGILR